MENTSSIDNFAGSPKDLNIKPERKSCAVSVIIVFSSWLENSQDSIRSILDQSFQNFEIILINIGEMDIRQHLADLDDRRIIVLQPDLQPGLQEARRLGRQNASGDYIIYLNAGEIYHKDHLLLFFQLSQLANNKKSLQVLTGQLSEKNQKENAFLLELAEIKGSNAWKALLRIRQLRWVIAPPGSMRSQIGGFILRGFRSNPNGVNREKQSVREIISQMREKEQAMQMVNLQINLMQQTLQKLPLAGLEIEKLEGSELSIEDQPAEAFVTSPAADPFSGLTPAHEKKPDLLTLVDKTWETLKNQGLMAVLQKTVERMKTKPATGSIGSHSEQIFTFLKANKKISRELVIQSFSGKIVENPDVSIVIPVYNHFDETIQCLLSILTSNDRTKYEVILADDGSNDETQPVFSLCTGLQYIRNINNLGFLRNCNNAAKFSRGRYVLFLNNDTSVFPGWLDSLMETFANFPDSGLVGSKLLFPDGSLQEAGGVIWEDGSGLNYGKWDEPQRPQYNYLREVDYCSGACILIPLNLWNQIGGFDELFAPAYYEDTDLAFKVRQAGYKVRYQPTSQVFHIEGASSGTDINSGVKQHQEINRLKFVSKWQNDLKSHGKPGRIEEAFFRDRSGRKNCLYIDATTPTPDQDSGSIDAYNFMKMFVGLGFNVTFLPDNLLYFDRYTPDLQKIGIRCQYIPDTTTAKDFLRKEGNHFDLVFISRLNIAAKYIDQIRRFAPRARIIFNTVDLHFLREERAAKLSGSRSDLWFSKLIRNRELSVMRKSDQTILVSEHEFEVVQTCDPKIKKTVIPIPRESQQRSRGFEGRKDILFVAGYKHPPNLDGILYFIHEIWPLIKTQLPDCKVIIGGSNMPDSVKDLAAEDIIILGFIPELEKIYSRCRLSIAPLRYGAGVKGKVVTSLGYGVPCVATSIATEGMGLVNDIDILVADSPDDFAKAVIRLYNSPDLWEKLSTNGFEIVHEKFSFSTVQDKLQSLLKEIGLS